MKRRGKTERIWRGTEKNKNEYKAAVGAYEQGDVEREKQNGKSLDWTVVKPFESLSLLRYRGVFGVWSILITHRHQC